MVIESISLKDFSRNFFLLKLNMARDTKRGSIGTRKVS
jgi:hypothetical protein